MITFKQFIAEISYDDDIYSKDASHHVANFPLNTMDWKPLMKVDEYEVLWRRMATGNFKIVLKADDKPAIVIEAVEKSVKVPGGQLKGVYPDSLSSNKAFRGRGLALKLYAALVKHGQVLFSSGMHTTGSRRIWEQLVQSGVGEPFVLAEEAAARFYQNKYKQHEDKLRVLLTGDFDAMNDEAYASDETSWVVVPHSMAIALKKNAIDLSKSKVSESATDDFLFGDCASFAVALQDKIGGELYALTRRGKALHVFLKHDGKNYDVKGERSTNAMARSIVGSTDDFVVDGPFTKDNQPCRKATPKRVAQAAEYISKNKRLFE